MSKPSKKIEIQVHKVTLTHYEEPNYNRIKRLDDIRLAQLGYKAEFRREFSVSVLERSTDYGGLK